MTGLNVPEEIDRSFFDDLLDDVPDIDGPVDGDLFPANWLAAETESLTGSDSVFSANSNLDLSAELSVSYEDMVQFERLSNFGDDSLTEGQNLMMNEKEVWPWAAGLSAANESFQTSSPVSVLESGSSCSGDKAAPRSPKGAVAPFSADGKKRGRARSKRSRLTTFTPRLPIQPAALTSPSSNGEKEKGETRATGLVIRFPKQFLSGHREKKMRISGGRDEEEGKEKHGSVRKCMHCDSTKTPQWRAGPMGPKTLCNACGVRYKTGRLFPEYRPATSPTFVPSVHSNSHKKVLEMRNKTGDKAYGGSTGSAMNEHS